jgi:hypothetical protein
MKTKHLQPFNANVFVSQVQMMDTESLTLGCHFMRIAVRNNAAENFPTKLASQWMVGVYEREVMSRGIKYVV